MIIELNLFPEALIAPFSLTHDKVGCLIVLAVYVLDELWQGRTALVALAAVENALFQHRSEMIFQ